MQQLTISVGNASCHLGNGPFWHLPERKKVHINHRSLALEKLGKLHTKTLNRLQEVMNTFDFDIIYKKAVKCQPII